MTTKEYVDISQDFFSDRDEDGEDGFAGVTIIRFQENEEDEIFAHGAGQEPLLVDCFIQAIRRSPELRHVVQSALAELDISESHN